MDGKHDIHIDVRHGGSRFFPPKKTRSDVFYTYVQQ